MVDPIVYIILAGIFGAMIFVFIFGILTPIRYMMEIHHDHRPRD